MPKPKDDSPTAARIRKRGKPAPEPPPDDDPTKGFSDRTPTRAEKRAANKRRHRARLKERMQKNFDEQLKCKGKTKKGDHCKSFAAADNNGFCKLHGPDAEAHQKYMHERAARARLIKAQKQPKPHALMQQVIESNPMLFMQPFLEAMGISVEYVQDEDDPEVVHAVAIPEGDGAVLFGVSKDGDVVISNHKDLEMQQRAAERLFDRVYGKPKQTNILYGGMGDKEAPKLLPYDEERQKEVADILAEATNRPQATPINGPYRPDNGDGSMN